MGEFNGIFFSNCFLQSIASLTLSKHKHYKQALTFLMAVCGDQKKDIISLQPEKKFKDCPNVVWNMGRWRHCGPAQFILEEGRFDLPSSKVPTQYKSPSICGKRGTWVSRRNEIIVIFLIYDFASIKIPSEVSTPSIISFHILYNVFFSNNFTSIYIFSKSLKDFLCEDLSNFFL